MLHLHLCCQYFRFLHWFSFCHRSSIIRGEGPWNGITSRHICDLNKQQVSVHRHWSTVHWCRPLIFCCHSGLETVSHCPRRITCWTYSIRATPDKQLWFTGLLPEIFMFSTTSQRLWPVDMTPEKSGAQVSVFETRRNSACKHTRRVPPPVCLLNLRKRDCWKEDKK